MTNKEASEILKRFDKHDDWRRKLMPFEIEARDMAIKALEQKESEQWIPVSARLPESDDKFIEVVVCDNIASWECLYNNKYGFHTPYYASTFNTRVYEHVKAWMPKKQLPEPYIYKI